jgi:hypothetical protein
MLEAVTLAETVPGWPGAPVPPEVVAEIELLTPDRLPAASRARTV